MLKWIPSGLPAVLLSLLVFPGLGQFYNRQWVKGLVLGGLFGVSFLLCAGSALQTMGVMMDGIMNTPDPQMLSDQIMHSMGKSIPGPLASLVFYVWAAVDAYRNSKRPTQEPI